MARKINRTKEGKAARATPRILDIESVNEVRKLAGLPILPRSDFYCKTKGCKQYLNLDRFLQGSYCQKCVDQRQIAFNQANQWGFFKKEK